MARPTHHKYHIGEHNPLKEGGNLRVVRREKPLNVSTGEPRENNPERLTPVAPTYRGMLTQHYWNEARAFVGRYPLMAFLAACGAGFLAGKGMTCAARKMGS